MCATPFFFFRVIWYTGTMPEQESITSLEEEIRALEEKLAARKATEESTSESASLREEKDIFRDVLKEHVESAKEMAEQHGAGDMGGSAETPGAPLHNYTVQAQQKADDLREKEHHEQAEALVEIALTKGILEAVRVARHLGNPHLLDDFHDALIDEYYDKLLQSRAIQ